MREEVQYIRDKGASWEKEVSISICNPPQMAISGILWQVTVSKGANGPVNSQGWSSRRDHQRAERQIVTSIKHAQPLQESQAGGTDLHYPCLAGPLKASKALWTAACEHARVWTRAGEGVLAHPKVHNSSGGKECDAPSGLNSLGDVNPCWASFLEKDNGSHSQ